MDATRTLRDEHQLILKVLDAFEADISRAREENHISQGVFEKYIEFFRGFADRCHHGKEEGRLFPCLQRCGMPGDCGPIAVMLEEHRQGRFHVSSMADALPVAATGNPAATDAFLRHAFAFLQLLRSHIGKEDHVLFQIADELVVGSELAQLMNTYGELSQDRDYQQTHARCTQVANELVGPGRFGETLNHDRDCSSLNRPAPPNPEPTA